MNASSASFPQAFGHSSPLPGAMPGGLPGEPSFSLRSRPLEQPQRERPDLPPGNGLLQRLPAHERQRLQAELEAVQLHDGQVLCEAGARQLHVYFPDTATLSLMSFTRTGDTCELMAIDREGFAGPDVAMGAEHSLHRLMVQRGGQAWRLRSNSLRQALGESPVLRQQLMAQLQLQMLRLGQGVVCHTHHSITERLCSWLLDNSPAEGSGHIDLTHETVASLLGVRRESVTQAAGRLQALGLLSTRRGQLRLHDREGLRAHACECHDRLAQARQRLLARDDEASTPGWLGQPTPGAFMALSVSTDGHGPAPGEPMRKGAGAWEADERDDDDRDEDSLYRELYEFAPVGFVTLDAQRRIQQSNIAAAVLLGTPASRLLRQNFSDLLQASCREDFARFHREVLGGRCRRHCDVALIDHGRGASTLLRLQASTDEDGQECRMVLMDLSEGLPAHNGQPRESAVQTLATITVTGDPQPQPPVLQMAAAGTRREGVTTHSLLVPEDGEGPHSATLTLPPGQGTASWLSGLLP